MVNQAWNLPLSVFLDPQPFWIISPFTFGIFDDRPPLNLGPLIAWCASLYLAGCPHQELKHRQK
jgi:hypothetical protein